MTDTRGTRVETCEGGVEIVREYGDDDEPERFFIDYVALDDVIQDLIEMSNHLHLESGPDLEPPTDTEGKSDGGSR